MQRRLYNLEQTLMRLSGELSLATLRLQKAVLISTPQSDILEEVLSEVQYAHTKMSECAQKLRTLRRCVPKPVRELKSESYLPTRKKRKRMYGLSPPRKRASY